MVYRDLNAENGNVTFWDEIAPVHYKSYNVEKLLNGGHLLDEIQVSELGSLTGKSILHLQCHIGTDSLSMARLGASVVGIDYSKESINIAEALNEKLKLDAKFIYCNIYEIEKYINQTFDIVYTSQGVLCWLSDINEWARIVARFLDQNGFFYIMETHPLLYPLNDSGKTPLTVERSYFHNREPTKWDDDWPDYSDPNYIPESPTFEWQWSISDIINSLISKGLKIDFIHEYKKLFYKAHADMKKSEDGWWYLPKDKDLIPLMFTLKASK